MKIAHINSLDTSGGAAKAALRLHANLLAHGHDSRFIVQASTRHDDTVVVASTRIERAVPSLRRRLDRAPFHILRQQCPRLFSANCVPDVVHSKVGEFGADIVHLHWIGYGFLRIETLGSLARPIVWTLHDQWPFTGGCHLAGQCDGFTRECGKCPLLGARTGLDLSRWIWSRKRSAYAKANMVVVAPSRWMGDEARRSSLFKNTQVEVIPNGVDVSLYRPCDRNAMRQLLGVPPGRYVILFSAAGGAADPNKGFPLLMEACRELQRAAPALEIEVLLAGAESVSTSHRLPVAVRCLGALKDEFSMVAAYGAADVVAVPSRQENLANAVLEALACGRPVVAFRVGGMPDMIEHGVNGYLASPYDPGEMAAGLKCCADRVTWSSLSDAARRTAETLSIETATKRYVQLYEQIGSM